MTKKEPYLHGHKCEMCAEACVMAFMSTKREILCRLCKKCHHESKLKTMYEVWYGSYLESAEPETDGQTGDADIEYVVKFKVPPRPEVSDGGGER